MDFGRLFSRAWEISWKNKFLFVLGFLAALGSGGGGSSSSPQFNYSFSGDELPPGWEQNLEQFGEAFVAIGVPILLTLLCVAFFLGIILWLVRLTSQAGLISAASRLDAGDSVGFGEAFRSGLQYLWRMVGLNLLLFLPFVLLGVVVAGFTIASVFSIAAVETTAGTAPPVEQVFGGLGIFALCMCLLACLLVPLYLLIAVIYPFAQRGVVLADLGIIDSIRHAWNVIKANFGEVLLLILVFVVLGFLSGIVAALVALPVGLLAFGPAVVDLISGGAPGPGDVVFLVVGGFLLLLVSAVVNTLLVTYRSVTVTLAYEAFVGKEPKLVE